VGFGTSRKKNLLVKRRQNKRLTLHKSIQTPLQIDWLLEFGCNGTFFTDEFFGTNVQRYHLFTLMVFEHHCQGLPIASIITSW
jgi:hypothetical protein